MYQVSEDELDVLASSYASAQLTLFGVAAGAALAVLLALVTVELDTRAQASFIAALLALIGVSALFGVRAIADQREARRRIDRIRRGPLI